MNLEFSHLCSVKDHIWDTDYRPVSSTEATYDWEFRVKDVNGGEMKHYIEKVVINLHETFPEPVKSKCEMISRQNKVLKRNNFLLQFSENHPLS